MTTISSASAANASYYASQRSLFGKLDSDQNGSVSDEEMVAGRPKGVSEAQASALYARIDVNGTNALTEDQLDQGMESGRYRKPEEMISSDAMSVLMLMSQQTGSFAGATPADLYAEMDSDGDGSVTSAEFLAARPDDVSEDDANALFQSIDTEGTGAISEEQFAASMRPAGGPPPGGKGGAPESTEDESSGTFDSLDANKDGVVSSDELLAALPSSLADFLQSSDAGDGLDKLLELFGGDR